MPVSRQRRKDKPRTSREQKARQRRARATRAAQQQAEQKKLSPAAYRRRRFLGWTLVVLALVVGVTHLMEHLQLFEFASPGVEDLVAGYPMAGLLGVLGAIVLSK